jgi:hypothetical protein
MKKKITLLVTAIAFSANAQELCFQSTSYVSGSSPNQLIAADFTGDGIPDIASTSIGEIYNQVKLAVGVGDGTFVGQQGQSYFPVQAQPLFLVAGDFNEDGFLDIATNNSTGGSISILLADGEGYFEDAVHYPTNSGETYPKGLATADFNNDGHIDLALGAGTNKFGIRLGAGDGTFGAATYTTLATDSGIYFVASGDLNNDGNDDVVTVNYLQDTISIVLGNGTGGFAAPVHMPVGDTPYSVTIEDIDGDDIKDLLVANFESDNVSVHRGIGDGTFVEPVNYAVDTPKGIAVDDFNNDGILDFVATNNGGTGSIAVFLGIGNGTFENAVSFTSNEFYPSTAVTGDFNNDGKTDIITSNYNPGNDGQKNISVFLNCMEDVAGTESFTSKALAVYPNPVSNQLQVQLPNGTEVLSAAFYNTLGQVVLKAGNETSWNVSGLSSGLHFVTLQTSEGTAQLKFIKE